MSVSPDLFDALLAITGDAATARSWMTPTLTLAFPAGEIAGVQWNGKTYLSRRDAAHWRKEHPQGQLWTITGKGVVVELRKALQHKDKAMLALLNEAIGRERGEMVA